MNKFEKQFLSYKKLYEKYYEENKGNELNFCKDILNSDDLKEYICYVANKVALCIKKELRNDEILLNILEGYPTNKYLIDPEFLDKQKGYTVIQKEYAKFVTKEITKQEWDNMYDIIDQYNIGGCIEDYVNITFLEANEEIIGNKKYLEASTYYEKVNDFNDYNKVIGKTVSNEIAKYITNRKNKSENIIACIAYFFYYAKKNRYFDQRSYINLKELSVSLTDETSLYYVACKIIIEFLNQEECNNLTPLILKYNENDFKQAVLYTTTEYEFVENMVKTPDSIIELALEMLKVKEGEIVADVCAGNGSFILNLSKNLENATYYTYEINPLSLSVAKMRFELLEKELNIVPGDIFESYNTAPKFDKVFANYPLGVRLKNFNGGMEYFKDKFKEYPELLKSNSSDWVFNSLIFDMLNDNGKAIGIMASGSTYNLLDKPIRKYFVENKMIEAVIALPNRMFDGTAIPTTLVVLSHNNEYIRLIDATKEYQSGRRQNEFSKQNIKDIVEAYEYDINSSMKNHLLDIATLEQVRENDYNLNPTRYSNNYDFLEEGVEFGSVIKNITRGVAISAKELDEMVSTQPTNIQYLMLANIDKGLIEDELPYLKAIDKKYDKYLIKNRNLIISRNSIPFKVAVAEVEENKKILGNGSLYIIELDEAKANPYYVKAFFESEKGTKILNSISVGTLVQTISVDSLKKVKICLPSIEEQNKKADDYLDILSEIKILKSKTNEAYDKLFHILDEEGE